MRLCVSRSAGPKRSPGSSSYVGILESPDTDSEVLPLVVRFAITPALSILSRLFSPSCRPRPHVVLDQRLAAAAEKRVCLPLTGLCVACSPYFGDSPSAGLEGLAQ
jgi:hypothetical protein